MTRLFSPDSLGPVTLLPGQLSLFPAAPGPHDSPSPSPSGAEPVPAGDLRGDAPAASRRDLRVPAAPRQVRLPPSDDWTARERVLTVALKLYIPSGKGLELTLTDNHYSMISIRRRPDGYRLRLHRMFVGAPPRTVRALARYVVHNDRRASQQLGDYIDRHQHVIKRQERKPRRLTVRTAGRHHDLQVIFDALNRAWFDSKLEARITWGPVTARKPRRSIKMGSFAVEDRIIRIHPVLDQPDVPDYFIRWIVFHEMLHGRHDIVRKGPRRIFHTADFLADERAYPDFARASAWEKANLDRLLGG